MTNFATKTTETLHADIGTLLRELETIATNSKPIGRVDKESCDEASGASLVIRGK